MFPFVVPDYEFSGYVYKKFGTQWKSLTLEQTFMESDIQHIWKSYEHNYLVSLSS